MTTMPKRAMTLAAMVSGDGRSRSQSQAMAAVAHMVMRMPEEPMRRMASGVAPPNRHST